MCVFVGVYFLTCKVEESQKRHVDRGVAPSPDVDHHKGERRAQELDVCKRSKERQKYPAEDQHVEEISSSIAERAFLEVSAADFTPAHSSS